MLGPGGPPDRKTWLVSPPRWNRTDSSFLAGPRCVRKHTLGNGDSLAWLLPRKQRGLRPRGAAGFPACFPCSLRALAWSTLWTLLGSGKMVREPGSERRLRHHTWAGASSSAPLLCDLRQVTSPLWAVSTVKLDKPHKALRMGLVCRNKLVKLISKCCCCSFLSFPPSGCSGSCNSTRE